MRGVLYTLLNLLIFVIYLGLSGRMGIYFDDSERNGNPYPRSTFGDMLILRICIGPFGTVACYLRQEHPRLGGRELKERLADYPVLYLTPISIQVTRRSFAVENSLVAVR